MHKYQTIGPPSRTLLIYRIYVVTDLQICLSLQHIFFDHAFALFTLDFGHTMCKYYPVQGKYSHSQPCSICFHIPAKTGQTVNEYGQTVNEYQTGQTVNEYESIMNHFS